MGKVDLLERKVASTGEITIKLLYGSLQDMNLTQKVFCTMFDNLCKNEFVQCLGDWNNSGKELLLKENIEQYMWDVEHVVFPVQLRMLLGMQGLKENWAKKENWKEWKRCQIFFTFFQNCGSKILLISHGVN